METGERQSAGPVQLQAPVEQSRMLSATGSPRQPLLANTGRVFSESQIPWGTEGLAGTRAVTVHKNPSPLKGSSAA